MRVSNATRICHPHIHVRTYERTDSRDVALPLRRYRSLSDARTENRSEMVGGWVCSELTCQHGKSSGDCPECRNGLEPASGDAA